ncbi:lasso peptide biosynthesis B2 protein [Actinoplanes sp. RD1]|uniref:lasso peptide biosynthesis B2 protein n=1 Tax=Actinoplanes sp. RD1 TaxID=3064538 RepID=UPI0027412867|nr:lasso peptide biosynthesis B2 protein [Actinoplanes sp. RD1]
MPVLPDDDVAVPVPHRLVVSAAVGVARVLARRRPADLCRILATVRRGAPPASYAEAQRARNLVLTVSTRCCGRKACLQRSIATFLVCRAWGRSVTWCAGVLAAPPFTAHAWVEACGRPVDESGDGTALTTICSV